MHMVGLMRIKELEDEDGAWSGESEKGQKQRDGPKEGISCSPQIMLLRPHLASTSSS